MSTEINGTRLAADGTVSCEVYVPDVGTFRASVDSIEDYVRVARHWLGVPVDGFAKRTYSHAEDLELRRRACEQVTERRIPRASVPPYVTAQDEPPLRACEADGGPIKVGGTISDEDDN